MYRLWAMFCFAVLIAPVAKAQSEAGSIAPLPFQAQANDAARIADPVADDAILTTKPLPKSEAAGDFLLQVNEPTPKPAIAPVPFGRGESSGEGAKPDAAYQPKIPFGRAEPSGPVIPSGPHTAEAVPVVGVDSVESSEAAPATPVAPEADPVQQNPEEPTELTSPIFEPEGGVLAPRKIVIRVLNKVTTQAQLIAFKPNDTSKVGQLQITAITCQKSAENSQADAAGLLDISELPATDKEKPKPLFRGWMYASSPSVTALEHPVYDVTMVRCEMVGAEPKKEAPESKEAKKGSETKADKKAKKQSKR